MNTRIYRTVCKSCKTNKSTGKDGYCDRCRKPNWELWQSRKGNRHERGYGNGWLLIRRYVLQRDNYLCQHCLLSGRYTSATEVDHIIPKSLGGSDSYDNLQSLCKKCHSRKTSRESHTRRLRG